MALKFNRICSSFEVDQVIMNSDTWVDEEDDVGDLFKLPPDRVDVKNDEEEADDNSDFTSLLETYTNNVIPIYNNFSTTKKIL